MSESGFENFTALGALMSGDAPATRPVKVESPTAALQMKLLRHVVGDSFNKVHVELINAYATEGEGITELERILNNPSAEILSKELHWGTTSTKTDDGTVTSPCLSILVTYRLSDYPEMLNRLEKHAEKYFAKDYPDVSERSMIELLIGGAATLKFAMTDETQSIRASMFIDRLKELLSRKKVSDPEPDPDAKDTMKKKKKKKISEVQEPETAGPVRVFQSLEDKPTGVQTTVFEIVTDAEKTTGAPVSKENVAKKTKKD